MMLLRNALASLRYRKARLFLSSLAIALGVAFVTGTLMLGASMNQQFYTSFAAGAKNVSAIVAAQQSGNPPGQDGGPTVPMPVLATVRDVPGVAAADGRVIGPAALLGGDGRPIGDGIGVNATSDPALSGFTLLSGRLPAAPDQVDVDSATAVDEHFRLGQVVRMVTIDGTTRTFYLAGIVDVGVNPQFGNDTVTVFQTPVAFRVTGAAGYNLIAARSEPGVSQAALTARIAAQLSGLPSFQVQTGAQFATEEANSAAKVANQLTTGILIFAVIALVVACIVVYNTFGILIAQRSRELALQRCVGATRRQVFGGMLAESLAVGLTASAAGVLAGIGVSFGLERMFGASAGVAPLVVSPSAVAIGAGAGLAVTLAASVLPARAATRISPIAVLSSQAADTVTTRTGWLRFAVAIVTGAGGIGLTVAGTRNVARQAGFVEIAAGGCVFFVAVLALGPVIAPRAIVAFGWLPGHLAGGAGVTARLATANGRRNPHRVAATTAALTIGITLMSLFAVVFSSIQASSDAAISGHYAFDYVVQANGPQPVPLSIVAALRSAPGLSVVAPAYARRGTVDGDGMGVGAYGSTALGTAVRPAMVAGSLTAVSAGTAAVNKTLRGARLGTTITVTTPDAGAERLRVVAVYDATVYSSPLPEVLISVPDYLRGFRPAGADEVVIDATPGVAPARSRAAVTAAIASDPLLVARTMADYKANLNARVRQVLEILGALLGLAILIALFGISSTLTLSVIERAQESALMRALGLTRGQLRRLLLTEALLMAAVAIVLGTGLGTGFGVAMMHAFSASTSGRGVLSIPYRLLTLFAAIGACAALVAAALPARRAAQTLPVGGR